MKALSSISAGMAVAAMVLLCGLAGFVFGVLVVPLEPSRMFPWMVARATGIGAFIALGGLTFLGMAFRRPLRTRARIHPETLLRLHVALGPTVIVLVIAHIGSLLADAWSGVKWKALAIPNAATYRPGPVTYGLIAAYLLVIVMATALLAGRFGVGARWAVLHRLAYPAFALTFIHGVLAGSDTPSLRAMYIVVGAVVLFASIPRLSRRPLMPGAEATR